LLRLLTLGHHHLFVDEAWSWTVAQHSLQDILRLSQTDPHPPLYYLLLKTSRIFFPDTESGLRVLSTFFSLASLALILIFVTRWWNKQAALYAGLLTTISFFELYHAQHARMYTLLGLLWLVSYILLLEGLQTRPPLLLLWGIINILMVWTHFYGFLALAPSLIFVLVILAWQLIARKPIPFNLFWLAAGISITIIGSLPMLGLLLQHTGKYVGGAWQPERKELLRFFSVFLIGRPVLHGQVMLFFLADLPAEIRWTLGSLFAVVMAPGMLAAWKSQKEQRYLLIFSLLSIFMPPLIVLIYGQITDKPVWADKSFLGVAYIYFIWMGIGFSQIPYQILRRSIATLMIIFSLLVITPYFAVYQKTDVVAALNTLPASPDEHHVILANYAWYAPLIFYYHPHTSEVWGLKNTGLVKVHAKRYPLPETYTPLSPDMPAFQHATDIMVYEGRIAQENYPEYLLNKNIWVFRAGKWQLLTEP
jgi:uncharacterized membrane protein